MSVLPLLMGLSLLTAAPPEGERIDLADGAKLFIPAGFQAHGSKVNILVHLHGTPTVTEPALEAVGWNAVLVSFNRNGLSSAYSKPFSDPALFPKLIDEAVQRVAARDPGIPFEVSKVAVSSFSAGFGGVREILKTPASFDRVDAIILADSLYCGYAGDPAEKRVAPDLMSGFERFARESAEGRKALLVSHSAQVPPGYASTTETADFLIKAVGAASEPIEADWGDSWRQTRRAIKGRFEVLGFAGEGPDDHMRHLRRIAELWKKAPDPFAKGR
ncbi:hypothetical protein [Planctomyces sp. SH-PL62]|uniref:hypothetical protein n=1 Tax=Planctomyces sp. SH-PL62 TaxID=1636152 RepID=UPI00078E58D0|nr:hypothetical protein [Planctomyces sp. SH-PL62]AMV38921.1 hypothetical protein VT85_15910 [Planctomyces sp. SH-PL62]